MRKTEYDPQAIRSISAFDSPPHELRSFDDRSLGSRIASKLACDSSRLSHKMQLIALFQNDIIGRDMKESSDDTMKNLSKKMKQHIIEEVHDHYDENIHRMFSLHAFREDIRVYNG